MFRSPDAGLITPDVKPTQIVECASPVAGAAICFTKTPSKILYRMQKKLLISITLQLTIENCFGLDPKELSKLYDFIGGYRMW